MIMQDFIKQAKRLKDFISEPQKKDPICPCQECMKNREMKAYVKRFNREFN